MQKNKDQGIAGVLGGIKSMGHLVQLLSPYFLPSSYATAPGATGSSGGRTTVLTTQTPVATPVPSDKTSKTLVAGTTTWSFTTKFNATPLISIAVHGAPSSSGTTLYIQTADNQHVVITSTSNTDTRAVDLIATGNPN